MTKSGTQSFRGNVFWSHQNDALDTNTWTREQAGLAKSPHTYNAYGFTLGGPIYIPGKFNTSKSKLFFFWGEEWQRDRTVEEQTAIVPTAAMRNGDFSALLPGRVIRDPLTGQPFQGNIIPAEPNQPAGQGAGQRDAAADSRIPAGREQLDREPARSSTTSGRTASRSTVVPSLKHRLAVRHTWAPNVWNDPEPMAVYSTIWDYPGRTLAATLTSTLSNSLMNEFSFSWGSTSPSKYFGQRNCDYCPGGVDALQYPTTVRRRDQLSLPVPGHEARSGQDPEHLAAGIHRRQQRRLSGIVERLRVPVGRQRHEGHRQPHGQSRA